MNTPPRKPPATQEVYPTNIRVDVFVHTDENGTTATLARIEAALQAIQTKETHMAVEIDDLVAQVAANTTVIGSAEVLLNGIQARIDAAIAAAQSGGASPAVLAQLKSLSTDLKTNDDALQAAIAANTPAAVPPVPAV